MLRGGRLAADERRSPRVVLCSVLSRLPGLPFGFSQLRQTGNRKAAVVREVSRDDNGYTRLDIELVFTSFRYVCKLNILPVGLLFSKNFHPIDKHVLERSAFTHTR